MFFHKYGNNTYKLIQFNVLCDFSKRFWRWLFHYKRNMCVVWMEVLSSDQYQCNEYICTLLVIDTRCI